MQELLFLIALGASLAGAYFIAQTASKRPWKTNATTKRIVIFISTFIFSFLAIFYVMALIIMFGFGFGR